MNNADVPIWEKYTLTIEEASKYFRIGENKLRKLAEENPTAGWIFLNGNRIQIKRKQFDSIIKYEGDNETLVWKHPIENFNMSSQLIVHESQEAIFFRDGQALDLFGPGRYTLETQQLPILERLYHLPTDTEGTFHSEVYYINKTVQMAIKWGTPDKIRFIDPLTSAPLEIGASGELNLQVKDSRKLLIKLVGTQCTDCQGPYASGNSRHCAPLRAIQSIPLSIFRSSLQPFGMAGPREYWCRKSPPPRI